MAETAVSMLPWPEIITTGSSGCWPLTRSSTWRPSRRLPCNQMSRKTRWGRRASIEARASSEGPAVRVRWPSSSRMPATSSRMSTSSSTTRISALMESLCGFGPGKGSRRLRETLLPRLGNRSREDRRSLNRSARFGGRDGSRKPHENLTPAAGRIVEKLHPAAVLFEDLGDDGQAEARAPLAGGHVGFEQPLSALCRKSLAVVENRQDHVVGMGVVEADIDAAGPTLDFGHRGDRFGRVLHDVGDRLRDQAAVEGRDQRPLGQAIRDLDL